MTTKYGWTLMAALWLAAPLAAGCDGGDTKAKKESDDDGGKKKKKKKKDDEEDEEKKEEDAKDEAAAATEDAKDAQDEGYAACGPLGEVPPIPSDPSKPPTVEEWNNACPVNTQGANTHPDDCEMKVLREWLRVSCKGNYTGYEKMSSFGAVGADYFEMKGNGLVSFVLKLSAGRNQKVRICKPGGRASLFVSWPSTKPKPLHIALAKGPSCEG